MKKYSINKVAILLIFVVAFSYACSTNPVGVVNESELPRQKIVIGALKFTPPTGWAELGVLPGQVVGIKYATGKRLGFARISLSSFFLPSDKESSNFHGWAATLGGICSMREMGSRYLDAYQRGRDLRNSLFPSRTETKVVEKEKFFGCVVGMDIGGFDARGFLMVKGHEPHAIEILGDGFTLESIAELMLSAELRDLGDVVDGG